MKKLLSFLCIACVSSVFGQLLEVNNLVVLPAQNVNLNSQANSPETTTCGLDTVGYALAKATGLQSLNINNATSAGAVAQYFDAPQAITISGVSFYGYKLDATGGTTQTITVQIFASAADSTPTGTALATSTIVIDTTFYPGSLDVLKKDVSFTSPITVSLPYVVVVSNPSANGMGMIFNSWTAMDGGQEWLSSAQVGANWLRSYNLNVGGSVFDADALFEPHVTYSINADFTIDNPCFITGNTLNFTNTSSPVILNKMYSLAAFQNIPTFSYTWDYGDGSALDNVVDGTNTYTSAGAYSITLSDTLFGWTTTCSESKTHTTNTLPAASWTSTTTSLTTTFTNTSSTDTTNVYLWDFGDGNTSTNENSVHTYFGAGSYTVCLTVTNSCGTDSSCNVVVVGCPVPVSSFSTANSGLTATFTNSSTGGTGVTYLWDFGDGNTSTLSAPTHTYAVDGMYTVCLTATDACGSDSSCALVQVNSCTNPVSSFNLASTGGATYNFGNTSTTTGSNVTYVWDFGDGNNSTLENPTHTYLSNGTFTVTFTVTDSCGTNSSTQTVTISGVGLIDLQIDEVVVYPNPSTDVLYVESSRVIQHIEISNITGQQVYSADSNALEENIDISRLANGTYTVSILFGSGQKQMKRIQVLR